MAWMLYEGDCFDYLPSILDGSVDMVLCDLPYGSTACKWDTPLPLDKLWVEYERVIKPNGAIVLTASQPFTTTLIHSNIKLFKYSLVWDKKGTTGFQNAKRMPLRRHEDVLVFYNKLPTYNPQMEVKGVPRHKGGSKVDNGCYGDLRSSHSFNNEYYPTSIVEVSNAVKIGLVHPTQKPVKLFEYLVKTYTNEGDTVLDNCAGSGTTGVACENLNRNSILIEKEPEYCQIIRQRLMEVTNQTKLPIEAK